VNKRGKGYEMGFANGHTFPDGSQTRFREIVNIGSFDDSTRDLHGVNAVCVDYP
jgi:hypothetical protein